MKIPISATLWILGIVLSTYFVARALLSETRHWAGSHAVANTPDGDIYLWLALWLPLGVGAGLLAMVCWITVRRWFGARRISEVRGLALVAIASCAVLWLAFSSLHAGAHRGPAPNGQRRWPKQLFNADQWAQLEERRLTNDLRGRTIPHDEGLLDRWTLVGLSAADVSELLRSSIDLQRPRQANIQTTRVAWRMCCPEGAPPSEHWVLELKLSLYDAVVIREALHPPEPAVVVMTGP